jgi:hypothetical protein
MDAIVKRLDALSMGKPVNAVNTFPVDSCSVCASPLHLAQNCPSMIVFFLDGTSERFQQFPKAFNWPIL